MQDQDRFRRLLGYANPYALSSPVVIHRRHLDSSSMKTHAAGNGYSINAMSSLIQRRFLLPCDGIPRRYRPPAIGRDTTA
jgi:hypothetical protein